MSRLASSRASLRGTNPLGPDLLDVLKWEASACPPAWGCAADLILFPALIVLLGFLFGAFG